jgi:hypothetical protein
MGCFHNHYNLGMRNRDRFLYLLLPALVLFAAVSLHAGDMTTLKIVVKTQAGRPVDRAEVIVKSNANPKKVRSSFGRNVRTQMEQRSNQDGEASFPPMPQGKLLIQVNAKGYQTYGKVFEINEDEKTVEIILNPPQQQYTTH